MHPRFAAFPSALTARARIVRLGDDDIPALLVHPDWETPRPTLLWLHGRTATKELDPGRYLRLMRAGIASCAIDLPGHGERPGPKLHAPEQTIGVLTQSIGEIDRIIEALADPGYEQLFDLDRLALGGMSAGGMITLRRLCDPHPFTAALVEATTGRLTDLYFPTTTTTHTTTPAPTAPATRPTTFSREAVEAIDPSRHLDTWEPLPLLAIHATTDQIIPFETQQAFLDDLRVHYHARNADPGLIELLSFHDTGAPSEHAGFGRFGTEAKNAATDFLAKHLL